MAIQIVANISRRKDNQAMKTDQLLEYNLRNIFPEKSYTKWGGETFPRPFSRKSKLSISLDQHSKVLYIWFLLFAKLRTIESDWNWAAYYLLLPWGKAFLKSKKKSGTSLPASFSAWVLKKNISLVIFYYLSKFQCLIVFTLWDIGQYVYCHCVLTRLWRHKFYLILNLIFLIKPFFNMTKKSRQNVKYLENEKSF